MKRALHRILRILGLLLLILSVVLALLEANTKSIIGGTDLPTFTFVFFKGHDGTFLWLAIIGIVFCVTGHMMSMKINR